MPSGRPLYEPDPFTREAANRYWIERLKRRAMGIGANSPSPGFTVETLYLSSDSSTGATSSVSLDAGRSYLITVQGTYSYIDHTLDIGTPEADAMYPGGDPSRTSTQVGLDPETLFAYYSGSPPATPTIGHSTRFQIDLGSGLAHVEPDDGPHTSPVAGHSYTYTVTGQGAPVSFLIDDSPTEYADDYGLFKIVIQAVDGGTIGGGGGSGSGIGSLVPPTDATMARDILRVDAAGVPAWEAAPDITEDDLDLTDVTTGDASTSEHGLLPKLPGDPAAYLNGDGAYTTPTIEVTDGTTTVEAIELDLGSGLILTDEGGGIAGIAVSANLDGGSADTTYLVSQTIDGGTA